MVLVEVVRVVEVVVIVGSYLFILFTSSKY